MNDKEILKKVVDEFLDPYDNDVITIDPQAQDITIMGWGILSELLAEAIHEFRIVDPNDYDEYIRKASDLLKWIEMAKTHRVIIDNLVTKQLEDCSEKRRSLESRLKETQSTIKVLEHKITELETTIRIFQKVHPDLKIATEESELTDG